MDTIAIFNNRQDALALANFLKRKNIAYSVISTPKKIVSHCALSVIFNHTFISLVKRQFINVTLLKY